MLKGEVLGKQGFFHLLLAEISPRSEGHSGNFVSRQMLLPKVRLLLAAQTPLFPFLSHSLSLFHFLVEFGLVLGAILSLIYIAFLSRAFRSDTAHLFIYYSRLYYQQMPLEKE